MRNDLSAVRAITHTHTHAGTLSRTHTQAHTLYLQLLPRLPPSPLAMPLSRLHIKLMAAPKSILQNKRRAPKNCWLPQSTLSETGRERERGERVSGSARVHNNNRHTHTHTRSQAIAMCAQSKLKPPSGSIAIPPVHTPYHLQSLPSPNPSPHSFPHLPATSLGLAS